MKTLRTVTSLAAHGLIAAERQAQLGAVERLYPVAITPSLAALIDTQNEHDPIARQLVPHEAELEQTAAENADPIGDHRHAPVEGIVHRHPDRVLLKIVHVCPVYCRFCFRREMVGPRGDGTLSPQAVDTAFAYICAHSEIWEVILTGGDPFMLSAERANEVTRRLASIPHVKTLRWHTRMPVADPERVSDKYLRAIAAPGKATYVVLHANHPRELSDAAREACKRIIDAGIPMLSQSVLLRGVNDDAETLAELMRAFVTIGIKPYYLHHCDRAPGTAHFRMSIGEGIALFNALRARVSGLCLPSYVLDIPGGYGKIPLSDSRIAHADGILRVQDDHGVWHDYDERNTSLGG